MVLSHESTSIMISIFASQTFYIRWCNRQTIDKHRNNRNTHWSCNNNSMTNFMTYFLNNSLPPQKKSCRKSMTHNVVTLYRVKINLFTRENPACGLILYRHALNRCVNDTVCYKGLYVLSLSILRTEPSKFDHACGLQIVPFK